LSTATQLRLYGLPIGISEMILVTWILFVSFLLLRGVRFTADRAFVPVAGYWLVSLTLLGLGMVVAVYKREANLSAAAHDGLAFAYVGVLACLLNLRFYEREAREYHWHLARATFMLHSWCVGLLFAVGSLIATFGPITFWYAGIRFRGWAENPNQMALAMIGMPFLGWYLFKRSSGRVRKAGYLLGIGICGVVGLATKSDALQVGWAAALAVTGALLWYRITVRGRSRWLHVSHVIIPALVVIVGVFYGDAVFTYFTNIAEGIYAEGDQGVTRFALWLNGLAAIAQSPLVGFGPGAFSGLSGPLQGIEAHNSLIDWGMSTGAVGMLLHIALWGWCLWLAAQSRSGALIGMAVAVMTYSLFGYMLRHPDYWLMLILLLNLAASRPQIAFRQAPALAAAGDPAAPAWQTSRLRLRQPKIR
jgi:hypothetical protein